MEEQNAAELKHNWNRSDLATADRLFAAVGVNPRHVSHHRP